MTTPQLKNLLHVANQLSLNDLEHLVHKLLQLQAQRRTVTLASDEADLLLKINQGLPTKVQQRYEQLFIKRQAETLTLIEHQELLELSEQFEVLNLQRLEHLNQLAKIRHTTLTDVMTQLGIKEPAVV